MSKSTKEVEALEDLSIVPNANDVFGGANLRSFSHYMDERITVMDQIKELEAYKKELDSKLTGLMTDYSTIKVTYNGRAVSLVEGSRTSLSKEKLLLKGVPATTIVECTDVSHYNYLLVGKEKQ